VSSGGRRDSFQNLILKGTPSGSFSLEPRVRGGEDLDVLGIANPLAGVDVDKNGHRWIHFIPGVIWFGAPALNARSLTSASCRIGTRGN